MLPEVELRYLKSVRRGQGEIEIFNRQAQTASGVMKGSKFRIEKVNQLSFRGYPITLAVGLPENAIIPSVIRSLSELGIEKLIFFSSARSQKGRERLKANESRWERITIESARQCGRGIPLEVGMGDWRELKDFKHRWFCDENKGSDLSHTRLSLAEKILIVVGSEGGWTEEERQDARDRDFKFIHFETPILRVETAVICAGFLGVQSYADAMP